MDSLKVLEKVYENVTVTEESTGQEILEFIAEGSLKPEFKEDASITDTIKIAKDMCDRGQFTDRSVSRILNYLDKTLNSETKDEDVEEKMKKTIQHQPEETNNAVTKSATKSTKVNGVRNFNLGSKHAEIANKLKKMQQDQKMVITQLLYEGQKFIPPTGMLSKESIDKYLETYDEESVKEQLIEYGAVEVAIDSKTGAETITKGKELLEENAATFKFLREHKGKDTEVKLSIPKDLDKPIKGVEITKGNEKVYVSYANISPYLLEAAGTLRVEGNETAGIVLQGVDIITSNKPGEPAKQQIVCKKSFGALAKDNKYKTKINKDVPAKVAKEKYGAEHKKTSKNTIYTLNIIKSVKNGTTNKVEKKLSRVAIKATAYVPFEQRASKEFVDAFGECTIPGTITPLDVSRQDDINKILSAIEVLDNTGMMGNASNELLNFAKELKEIQAGGKGEVEAATEVVDA